METIQKYEINFSQTFKICWLGHYEVKIAKKMWGPRSYKKDSSCHMAGGK